MVTGTAVAFGLCALLGAGSAPASSDVEWSANWRCDLEGRGAACGASADLDGDGLPEIVVVRYHREEGGAVFAIDGRTGRVRWRRVIDRPPYGVADLNQDGTAEVVVVRGHELAVLAGSDGAPVAAAGTRGIAGALAVGDLGGDGRPEILCASGIDADDSLVALSGSGLDVLWDRRATVENGPFESGLSHVVCADVDGDGGDEVLAAENGNRLVCVGPNGAEIWGTTLGEKSRLRPHGVVSSDPCVFHLGGGFRGVAVGCFAGALVVCDAETGEIVGRTLHGSEAHERHIGRRRLPSFIARALRETGEPVSNICALGDTLVFGCSDGRLYAVRAADQSVLWSFDCEGTVYERCVPVEASAPGVRAILAWDERRVYLLDAATGREVPSSGKPGSGASAILAGDFDGDGGQDVIVVGALGRTVTAWSLR